MTEVIAVIRALIDAAFSTGGITDIQHTALHDQLNAADPATAKAAADAQAAADAEAADHAAYEAWKAQQSAPAAAFGTEEAPGA